VFNNERQQKLIQPLFAAASPDKVQKLVQHYKSLLFPETRYDEFKYMQKSKKMFDRMKDYEFRVTPIS